MKAHRPKPFTWIDCGATWVCDKCNYETTDKGPRSKEARDYRCPEHGMSFMLRRPWQPMPTGVEAMN